MLLNRNIALWGISYWIAKALEIKGSWLPLPKWTLKCNVEKYFNVLFPFFFFFFANFSFQGSRIRFQLQIGCCVKGRRENSLLAEFHLGNCFVLLVFIFVLRLYCMWYLKAISYPKKADAALHTSYSVLLKRS